MTAGYSKTPLVTKLGIKKGHTLVVIGAPEGLEELLAPLPPAIRIRSSARGKADVALFFASRSSEVRRRVDSLGRLIFPAGSLWVCWPKQASGVATDVSGNAIREIVLPTGMVDVKVAAIDETWSGLKMMWRKELRGA